MILIKQTDQTSTSFKTVTTINIIGKHIFLQWYWYHNNMNHLIRKNTFQNAYYL